MEKVKVLFKKSMYPYRKGEEGFVKQSVIDKYPDYVEIIKETPKKEVKKTTTTKKEVTSDTKTTQNKRQTKKSTKSL